MTAGLVYWMIVDENDLYWSNENGWGDEASATRFTTMEQAHLNLPIGGHWVRKEDHPHGPRASET